MNIYQARKLARYHKFTKLELHNILKKALETYPSSFWEKPNTINKIFDNGYHFNLCRDWIGYEKGINDDDYSQEIIVVRILQTFGKCSEIQLPKKIKSNIKIQASQKPKL